MRALEVDRIAKSYGKTVALSEVSFEVEPGELFGIIGPDGAGKSTLFRILTTLILADSGVARVQGLDVKADYRQIRGQVGYMPGRFSLYQDMTVLENLTFFATLFGTTIQQNYHLVADIYSQIEPFKHRRAGDLSGGMKQKLALSCALIHKPTVLFLDEPTTGVDPVSRKEFWQMLSRLKQQGITILVSTPYMDEAVMCDRIALIRQGCFMEIDTPAHIIDRFDQPLWAVQSTRMSALLKQLRVAPDVESCFAFGDQHHITVGAGFEAGRLLRYLTETGYDDVHIKPIKATIEDCYMKLQNKSRP